LLPVRKGASEVTAELLEQIRGLSHSEQLCLMVQLDRAYHFAPMAVVQRERAINAYRMHGPTNPLLRAATIALRGAVAS
jgi:hypothetical protein